MGSRNAQRRGGGQGLERNGRMAMDVGQAVSAWPKVNDQGPRSVRLGRHLELAPENQTVRLFDFKDPEKNDFLVTNQLPFKKYTGSILPDITIFVNGFPLVIIECKSPKLADPIGEAVRDN